MLSQASHAYGKHRTGAVGQGEKPAPLPLPGRKEFVPALRWTEGHRVAGFGPPASVAGSGSPTAGWEPKARQVLRLH